MAQTRDTNEVRNRFFSRMWVRLKDNEEQVEHRRQNLAGLSGRVLELGAGDGRNFALYPPEVTEVLAVEPEPYLREHAEAAAREARVKVTVVAGVADRLPAEDASVDAAVASLVLCTVPDQPGALAELRRVIKPGGELRFLEHVHSNNPRQARIEDLMDHVWPHIAGGCHPNRDTAAAIAAAGFEVERCDRFGFSPGFPMPKIAHILGVGRKPV
ncbi:MAG TPA: class I SAM-dependent methyltransferase [Thermoleophilaceae bacterium]